MDVVYCELSETDIKLYYITIYWLGEVNDV